MTPSDSMQEQVFGIVGVGPVGSILAGHLAKHGSKVVLVDILKDHLDTIKTKGLTVSGVAQFNVRIPDVCYSVSELAKHRVDAIFISVKASLLPRILAEIKSVAAQGTYLICFQNGLDNELVVAKEFGEAHTLRCVINYAGNMKGDGHVDMTFFNKPNYIGTIAPAANEYARRLAEILTAAGLETKFTETIKKFTWEKTILNAGMLALCAVTKQTMKDAFDFKPTHQLVEGLVKESISVAKADGFDFGPGFVDFCMNYFAKAGRHKPSMLVDLENQRPTEIDFINGRIVEYGEKLGVRTPYNLTITSIVKALESGYKKA